MTTDGHTVPRTGNGFIDVTHASLMERVGIIRRQCASGAPQTAVIPHFNAFVDEMRAHFVHEEVIIRAAGFPRWEDHAHHHAQLDEQIGRLVDYVRECEVTSEFLCAVAGTVDAALCRHEIRHDSEYMALVRDASVPRGGQTLIRWEPGFDVGIGPLDAQHRQLVECLNEAHRLCIAGGSDAEVLAVLDLMHDHVHAHFAMEEGVLRRVCLSRFVAHRAHHQELAAQFARIRQEIGAGRLNPGVAVRDFLRFWLMDHLLGPDRDAFTAAGDGTPQ